MAATLTNVTLRVLAGFGSGPLEEFPTFEDITSSVRGMTTQRGRNSLLDRYEAGTGELVLVNTDGKYDPANLSSVYYPDESLGTQVRIEVDYGANTYILYHGVVESWPVTYSNSGKYSEVTLPLVDLQSVLASFSLSGYSYLEQLTGERIHGILDDIGWPSGRRDIDVGSAYVPADSPTGSAFDHILEVVDVEAGHFFIAANGYATFRSRAGSAGLASSYTFADTGNIRYQDLQRAYDKDNLYNVVLATRPDGVQQSATDPASIDTYGPLTLEISAPFIDDNAADNVADWQVARLANTVNRVTSLTVNPDRDAATNWVACADLELRDGVTVQFQPPGGGTAINQVCSVEGISHEVSDGGKFWFTTFTVWPLPSVETTGYWVLGTSALDSTAVLA